jgi:putative ubiquitin-RnfH superfamily antitoxin RatB of RatAB toxin-antitoxin module
VLATINVAPSGGDLVVAVTQNETVLCQVTIPNGSTVSNTVDGFGLPVLTAGATLNINIVSVASGTDSMPGQDLTVTVTV